MRIVKAIKEKIDTLSSYIINDVTKENIAAEETNGVTILYLPCLSA